jgi:hypothetical protein
MRNPKIVPAAVLATYKNCCDVEGVGVGVGVGVDVDGGVPVFAPVPPVGFGTV